MTILLRIILGGGLLLAGRRLFWLFVGGVGFITAFTLATGIYSSQPGALTLLITLAVGIVGAVLALFMQRAVIGVAGLLAGGYSVYVLIQSLSGEVGGWGWILIAVGAVLGALLVGLFFEWALIILSSLTGASMITSVMDIGTNLSLFLFLGLALIGIIAQATLMGEG